MNVILPRIFMAVAGRRDGNFAPIKNEIEIQEFFDAISCLTFNCSVSPHTHFTDTCPSQHRPSPLFPPPWTGQWQSPQRISSDSFSRPLRVCCCVVGECLSEIRRMCACVCVYVAVCAWVCTRVCVWVWACVFVYMDIFALFCQIVSSTSLSPKCTLTYFAYVGYCYAYLPSLSDDLLV